MFHRMFGRRKSPVEEEGSGEAVEATEETPETVTNEDFVVINDSNTNLHNGYGPPPGYTVGAANAFLPYGLEPKNDVTTQRSTSFEGMSAIDGISFKFGSNVLLEETLTSSFTVSTEEIMSKIKSFNWDDYEYSFELEKSIIQEFETTENNTE